MKTGLGIELGSTRIKAVLTDGADIIATGAFEWENRFKDNYWTYYLDDAWTGINCALAHLCENIQSTAIFADGIGISGMMHGYLAFDKEGNLLTPFRTWRNTTTQISAEKLTKLFNFNIPQRWSIAHLYQAILNGEAHVDKIDYITTLAGYVHWQLTGEKSVGIGEASGMFPVDCSTNSFNNEMIKKFNAVLDNSCIKWRIEDILPKILLAGDNAGSISENGVNLLKNCPIIKAGTPLCPAEGDAATGMVATNSIASKTGNISAGTSIFAMIVLEKPLSRLYTEIDIVTTPDAKNVAMVHCNTCTSELDAWVKVFLQASVLFGNKLSKAEMYDLLYNEALNGQPDCGGLVAFNYFSGEPITDTLSGRPLLVRAPESVLSLANLMRAQLYSCIATLRVGMDILFCNEAVALQMMLCHGGLFKTKNVGRQLVADALNTQTAVMESAAEGGPWGTALLAAYMINRNNETLEEFLNNKVFANSKKTLSVPNADGVKGFNKFLKSYKAALSVEKNAIENIK